MIQARPVKRARALTHGRSGLPATTVERLESDLPAMQRRAAAWAVGDVALLRTLPYPNQREACMSALSSVPNIKALVDHASQAWLQRPTPSSTIA